MFKTNQQIIYSPTDLTTFMKSPFASWMNRLSVEFPEQTPQKDAADELSSLLSNRGLEHEEKLISQFESEDKIIIKIDSALSFAEKRQATLDAMKNGADIIYQPLLESKNFRGYADFLIKVSGKSNLGNYHYEVLDTKLASHSKPEFAIQLCCYAEMLEEIQGVKPAHIKICLGNSEIESLKTDDYFYYYLSLKTKFLHDEQNFDANSMPDPYDSKSYGQWSDYAQKLLENSDHLSLVANITRSQIKKLNRAGITTCQELINFPDSKIPGLKAEVLERLKAQADIQKRNNGNIPPLFEIKSHAPGEKAGLALLPPHSANDVFFDIEGFPLDEGGLEYLWGNTYFDEQGNRLFKDFWAHNKPQEKQAFKEFITWVYERWQLDPAMHIYHYANYEIAACRKLMNRYGICEYEVDQLLRNEVFVDLYKIVKSAILLGEPRYSIKNVEHLYRSIRDTEVGCGSDSVVVYENWRELNIAGEEGDTWETSKILNDIREYNIDDCNSTQELVVWLRNQQQQHNIEYLGKTEIEEPEIPEEVTIRTQLRDKLISRAESEAGAQAQISENMAWTLEFHRREAKPVFWRLFDRLGLPAEELEDDIDCLAKCVRTNTEPFKPTARARSLAYEYRFDPNQEFKANAKSYYVLGMKNKKGNDLQASLLPEHSDLAKGKITLKSTVELPQVVTLVPDEYVNPNPIPKAIDSMVNAYEQGNLGDCAILDFLERKSPRITGRQDLSSAIVESSIPEERMQETIAAVINLDNSYLTIQGPPGAGKTYTGKHIIAELVKQGKKVGISSNSHKAINNLLLGTAEYCAQNQILAKCYCTKNTGNEIEASKIEVIKNSDIHSKIENGCIVGTTAWGFCRDELADQFDYLFIDEAGQVSVANLIGMSKSAKNLILMGDQMQLGQPSQATHPADSGLSVLDYLLHETPIIKPEMGIFLGTTYRMHSKVNEYISHAIYEGQLISHQQNDKQQIEVPPDYQGEVNQTAGVIFLPIDHEGNTQASDEEVELIKQKTDELIGRIFTDKSGNQRPISWSDMLFVAPYNHQVNKLKQALGDQAKVGSVDKFQGQEAPVVFFSLCTSDPSESPRGIDFLFDKHRTNVAISRAQALAIIVGNPNLFSTDVNSLEQMKKVNVLARLRF